MKHRFLINSLLATLTLALTLALTQIAIARNTSRAPVVGRRWSVVVGRSSFIGPAQNITDPNDPHLGKQYALKLVGASCAWEHTIGSPDVSVAIVDSGVDMKHPDLVDRLRDDGHDFVDGDDDPSDENGHGTNVAGIVAATLDNDEGGAGLAPGVMILPVRVMNAKGYGSDRAIARGVRYAADKGAKVINLSLGATLTIGADTESAQVSAAIRYAQDKGALVVVAAGNDFVPLPNAIVGDNPDALIVAATDEDDVKADFSNSGAWIGVTAPGVHIFSAMPTYEVYLTSDAVPSDERFEQNYDYMSGTSQATPLVSALAALLFSAHPDWGPQEVAQAIKDHAADISRQNRRLVAKGFLGSGRIDACEALGGPVAAAQPTAEEPAPTEPVEDRNGAAPTSAPAAETGSSPAAPRAASTLLLIVGIGACGLVLLLSLILFAFVRSRRPRAAPAAPVYTPAPVGAPQQTPVSPAAPIAAGAWGALTVIGGPAQPTSYPLAGSETLIGRDTACTIQLAGDGTISRRHAIVRNDGRQITVEDAGSSHGTYLNGQPISGPAPVRRGAVLRVGQTLLRFE